MSQDNYRNLLFPQAPTLSPNYVCKDKCTVKAGDTLYTISQSYGIPVAILMQVNRIMNPYCLKIGQTICIPDMKREPLPEGNLPEESPPSIEVPPAPEAPSVPEMPRPSVPQMPSVPEMPMPSIPQIPSVPEMPMPSVPQMPSVPETLPEEEVPPIEPPMPEVSPPTTEPVCDGIYHTIVAGDSFYKIAKRYQVTLNSVINANPNLNPYNLQIGSRVCVPTNDVPAPPVETPPPTIITPPTTEPVCDGIYHTIVAGDSFYKIAKRYQVPLNSVINANQNLNPYNLRIGSRVCIPNNAGSAPLENASIPDTSPPIAEPVCNGTYHTVVAGDSFYKIARRYQIPLDSVIDANPNLNPYNLRIGSRVCVPTDAVPAPQERPSPPAVEVPSETGDLPEIDISPERISPPEMPSPRERATPPEMPAPRERVTLPQIEIPPERMTQTERTAPREMPTPPKRVTPQYMVRPAPIEESNTSRTDCDGLYHTVVKNDTLYMISNRYGVSLDDILEANPNLDPYNLRIGMKLCIPIKHEVCPRMDWKFENFHFVHIGDNFDMICRRFGVLPMNLLKANPSLTVVDYSVPGTKICIPK